MARVKLGDVAREYKATIKNATGLPTVGLEHLTPSEIVLERWDEGAENTFTKGFKKGHMLFGRRRAYLKKAALAPFDGICSGDIIVIEAIPEKIHPELLPFIIQNDLLFDYAVGNSAGSLSPRVKWESLKDYEFELPDLDKQDDMVELLKAAHRTRKAYQNQIAATDELVKSQFIEMFGDPESVLSSDVRIADVADVQVGIVIKPTRFYADGDNGIKAFRSLNIGPMYIKDEEWVYFTEAAMEETQRTVAHTGDVLVVRSGNPGTSAVVTKEFDGCNVIDLIIAHPKKDLILPEFLCAYTNLPHGKNQIESQQRGVAQKHFNVGMYNDLKLILPPIAEQERFVRFLKQSDKSKFELEQAVQRIDNLIKSLIQQDDN